MKYLNTRYRLFESEINDIIEKCKIYKIEKYEINDGGLLTVHGDVNLRGLILNELPLSFKEVYGDFDISYSKINCLKGSPEIIHRDFIFENIHIKNLKYCPKEIHRDIMGNFNKNIKNLIKFPNYVGGSVCFIFCDLRSLYGCINIIHEDFFIEGNISLKSLRYGPKHVIGIYDCNNCGLTSLHGAPKYIGDVFNCISNYITSLKYSPKYIGGDLLLANNEIKSFDYFPEYVGGEIYFDNNPVHEIWKLFKDKDQIEYFNQMKIVKGDTINIKKLNVFLKSINKEPVEYVKGYVNI